MKKHNLLYTKIPSFVRSATLLGSGDKSLSIGFIWYKGYDVCLNSVLKTYPN